MKLLRLCLALAFLSTAIAPFASAAPTDAEVAARKAALELAGAFSNDGFKLRDGSWCGPLLTSKPALVQVNLYAGNEYWFSVGSAGDAKKVAVTVYDETGASQEFEPYAEGSTAAAGFSPTVSGPYYIKVEELEGATATFCLVYSYK